MRVFNKNVSPAGRTLLTKAISGFIERLSMKVKRLSVTCANFKQPKGQELRNTRKGTMEESVANVTDVSLKQK